MAKLLRDRLKDVKAELLKMQSRLIEIAAFGKVSEPLCEELLSMIGEALRELEE